jgi:hypothetical protein
MRFVTFHALPVLPHLPADRYLWLYLLVVKSFLVYVSDIYTAVIMLTSHDWTNIIFTGCQDRDCAVIPFKYGKWLFVGCIILSFLLVRSLTPLI